MNKGHNGISFRAVQALWPRGFLVAICILITACSGGKSEMNYLDAVKKVNYDWVDFPFTPEVSVRFAGHRKIWKNLPVPVYGEVDALIVSAIDRINKETGISLLVVSDQVLGPGIKVSYGTAVQPKDIDKKDFTKTPARGTVSGEIGGWMYPNGFPLDEDGNIDGEIILNLQPKKAFTEDGILLVAHEFGHALGLFDHVAGVFNASGGPPITDKFYALLAMLYKR